MRYDGVGASVAQDDPSQADDSVMPGKSTGRVLSK